MITFNMISHNNTSIPKIIVTGDTEPHCATKCNIGEKISVVDLVE